MTLDLAPLRKSLTIQSFGTDDQSVIGDLESRLMHLGFIQGAQIIITQKAPFFKGPLLIDVRGRKVALTISEAKLVQVEVNS
jgi:Fe2+ transport system protein FeoA